MTRFNRLFKRITACTLAAMLLLGAAPDKGIFKGAVSYVQAEGEDLSDVTDVPEKEPRVTDEERKTFADPSNPYEEYDFKAEADKKSFLVKGTGIKAEKNDEGVLISGKNADVKAGYITISKMYDFGTGYANRIKLDALSKRATKTIAKLYLDESDTPFMEVQLKMQTKKNVWTDKRPTFYEIPAGTVSGKHYITIELEDKDTKDSKNTEILLRNLVFYKESVPTVYITIDESYTPISDMNNDPNHETECYGTMDITVPKGFSSGYSDEGVTDYTGGHYDLDYIRGRGNSTWSVEKKPYKIKLDKDDNLFGMGKNKHWTLIANYYDNSLVRNRLTYYLGQKLGMPYTPQLVPVDVVMNDNYLGSYFLCEQIRVGKSRVDIYDLEDIKKDEQDITGGYLLGLSPYGDEQNYVFKTSNGIEMLVESPEELSNTDVPASRLDEMNKYIEGYVNDTEAAIFGSGFKDPKGKSYTEYMDVSSAAKYYLIQEFSMNGDAYGSTSTYLYKDKGGKLCWGPLWDFDYVAWASTDYMDYDKNDSSYTGFSTSFPWFERLRADKTFINEVNKVWGGKNSKDPNTLCYQLNELIKTGGVLDKYADEMESSAKNNFDKWGLTDLGFGGMDNGYDSDAFVTCSNQREEIARLKKWITKRMDWFDENISTLKYDTYKISFYVDNKLVSEATSVGDGGFYDFPEVPKKNGYVFTGWYATVSYKDEETGEVVEYKDRIVPGQSFYEDTKVEAEWIKEDEIVHAQDIFFEYKEVYVAVGESVELKHTIMPLEAADYELTFTSSDESIATVDSYGFVETFDKTGDVTITLTTIDKKKATCLVHVVNAVDISEFFDEVALSENEISLRVDQWKKIYVNYTPANVMPRTYTIININPEIAMMDDTGVITAYGEGNAKIVVYFNDSGTYDTVNVEVLPKALEKGTKFTNGKLVYEVVKELDTPKGGTARVVGIASKYKKKLTSLSVPATVTGVDGTYKVVGVKAGAFKKNKKLKTVTIGKNVTSIGKNAFNGCTKLKKVTIKATKAKFGKNAFKGISSKASFFVPKKQLKSYKSKLKKLGIKPKQVKKIKTTTKKTTTKKTTTKKSK